MDGGHILLSAGEWEFIFKSLDMARHVFANNPVLEDIMLEEERDQYILDLSGIMDKIGVNGKEAYKRGTNVRYKDSTDEIH